MKGCERTSRRATLRARLRRPKPSPPVENSRRSAGRKLRWGGNQDASTRMLDSPGRPRENPPAWAPDKGARRVFPDRATGSRIGLPLKRRKSGSLAVPAPTYSVDFVDPHHFKLAAPAIHGVEPAERYCHSQSKEQTLAAAAPRS
jgi:hypothetical protein